MYDRAKIISNIVAATGIETEVRIFPLVDKLKAGGPIGNEAIGCGKRDVKIGLMVPMFARGIADFLRIAGESPALEYNRQV